MKRALALTAVLALLISLAAGYAETAPTETVWTTSLTARCASVEEGRQLMRGRTLFHEQIRKKALAFFLQKKDGTLEDYIRWSEDQVLPFTPEEERRVLDTLAWLKDLLERHGLKLPDPGELTFVKTMGQEALGSTGYTSGGTIFINARTLRASEYPDEPFRVLVTHEISHCLSRKFPEYRQALYSLVHFTVLDEDIPVPEEILENVIANPDVEHHDSCATFTIGGEKKDCYLLFMTDSVFEKPGDTFFSGIYSGIVPLDGSRVYRVDEVEDFWDVVGRNTSYVEDPEELMAVNFSIALTQLDIGYESFRSPEIPEGIIAFLKR